MEFITEVLQAVLCPSGDDRPRVTHGARWLRARVWVRHLPVQARCGALPLALPSSDGKGMCCSHRGPAGIVSELYKYMGCGANASCPLTQPRNTACQGARGSIFILLCPQSSENEGRPLLEEQWLNCPCQERSQPCPIWHQPRGSWPSPPCKSLLAQHRNGA